MLVEYSDGFPEEEKIKAEKKKQIEFEKAMGLRKLTAADYRKIFSYSIKDGCIVIDKYKGTDTLIEIPGFIGKKSVNKISDSFLSRPDMICIIPDSVDAIGSSAFEGCDNLVIRCAKDSYAYEYAMKNGIKTETL
jgi:hypothetical protein